MASAVEVVEEGGNIDRDVSESDNDDEDYENAGGGVLDELLGGSFSLHMPACRTN